jgi:hypothetical protein
MGKHRERRLFSSLFTDQGSHYWHTPVAGGKVDKGNPTQFGRAMRQLGIEMIPAYSPEARGRSERMFLTHQDRLVKELAVAGIIDLGRGKLLSPRSLPAYFQCRIQTTVHGERCSLRALIGPCFEDKQHERVVGNDNCDAYERLKLQIPADRARMH